MRYSTPVAPDERRLGNWEREHGQAVDECVIGIGDEPGQGAAHRLMRGFEDIEPVHFLRLDHGHRPLNVHPGGQLREKALALAGGELF